MDKSKSDVNEKTQINSAYTFQRSVSQQIILGIITNFALISPSMSLGFSAVALPPLTAPTNPNALNANEASWFASIASLATPFGCLLSGPIADKFGRKSAMITLNIVCFIGWLLIASAYYTTEYQYLILLIGRAFTGLSTGLSSMPTTIYVAEIASLALRGVLCTWTSISFAIGVLVVYILGYFLMNAWGVIALIAAFLPILSTFFLICFVPESPSWLVGTHRIREARRNMCKIWGAKESNLEIHNAIENLQQNKLKTQTINHSTGSVNENFTTTLKQLLRPTCLKPFLIISTFFFFQQFSGTFIIVFYAVNIVHEAKVKMDAYLTIVLIGIVRLISAILVSWISKIYGRRPLSIISGIGMTFTMILLCVYLSFINNNYITKIDAIPVILLLGYFFTSNLGFFPMPFAMTAEVYPANIRGLASGITVSLAYFFNFITVKIYPTMNATMGSEGVFFFYGIMSLLGTAFVCFVLPETKGKTLEEIQEKFENKKEIVKINALLGDEQLG